ncbi:MAG TPA: heme o synthase, partial [Sphingomonadales bacterium]|nr:heme o synthase [Sphingomonadales bacterium]
MSRAATAPAPGFILANVSDYWEVLKPRVMSLAIFTALAGLLLAPGHIHPVLAFAAILFTALGAGAAGCLNMWFEADLDARMVRTRNRPIPAGRMEKGTALGFGVTLGIASVTLMALFINGLAAFLLALSIGFYVLVYTAFLKRRTPQNIVIGGAAGALPPVIGWAAATGSVSLFPLLLFGVIFAWTPAHFWALALSCKEDYARARVPMLPNVAGDETTRRHIFAYAVLTALLSFGPVLFGFAGTFYGAFAAVFGAAF